jgi:hypothetical protein
MTERRVERERESEEEEGDRLQLSQTTRKGQENSLKQACPQEQACEKVYW